MEAQAGSSVGCVLQIPLWHLFALSNGASLTPAYARSYYGRDLNFVPLRAAGGTEGAAKQAGRASYEEALPPLPSSPLFVISTPAKGLIRRKCNVCVEGEGGSERVCTYLHKSRIRKFLPLLLRVGLI